VLQLRRMISQNLKRLTKRLLKNSSIFCLVPAKSAGSDHCKLVLVKLHLTLLKGLLKGTLKGSFLICG
jgi:hypothetical protein